MEHSSLRSQTSVLQKVYVRKRTPSPPPSRKDIGKIVKPVAKSKGWNIVKMLLLALGSLCMGFYMLNVVSPNTSEKYVKPLQLKFLTELEAIGLEKRYALLAQSVHEKCGAIKDGIKSTVTVTKQALFLGGPSSAEEPVTTPREAVGSAANEESASPPAEDDEEDEAVETDNVDTENT